MVYPNQIWKKWKMWKKSARFEKCFFISNHHRSTVNSEIINKRCARQNLCTIQHNGKIHVNDVLTWSNKTFLSYPLPKNINFLGKIIIKCSIIYNTFDPVNLQNTSIAKSASSLSALTLRIWRNTLTIRAKISNINDNVFFIFFFFALNE